MAGVRLSSTGTVAAIGGAATTGGRDAPMVTGSARARARNRATRLAPRRPTSSASKTRKNRVIGVAGCNMCAAPPMSPIRRHKLARNGEAAYHSGLQIPALSPRAIRPRHSGRTHAR